MLEELDIAAKILVGLRKETKKEDSLNKSMVLETSTSLYTSLEDSIKICIKKTLYKTLNMLCCRNWSSYSSIHLMESSIKGNLMEKLFLGLSSSRWIYSTSIFNITLVLLLLLLQTINTVIQEILWDFLAILLLLLGSNLLKLLKS